MRIKFKLDEENITEDIKEKLKRLDELMIRKGFEKKEQGDYILNDFSLDKQDTFMVMVMLLLSSDWFRNNAIVFSVWFDKYNKERYDGVAKFKEFKERGWI